MAAISQKTRFFCGALTDLRFGVLLGRRRLRFRKKANGAESRSVIGNETVCPYLSAQHHTPSRGCQVGQGQHGVPAVGQGLQPRVQDEGRPNSSSLCSTVRVAKVQIWRQIKNLK